MNVIDCDASHLEAIRAILNHEIAHSTALWEERPRSPEQMAEWFETKRQQDRPVIGAVDDDGRLLAFATYGEFRSNPGYRFTAEHSVYVAADARRRGLGRVLVKALIERAKEQGLRCLVGAIDGTNAASRRLHEELGFVHAGSLDGVGFKWDRWLDVYFYVKRLDRHDG